MRAIVIPRNKLSTLGSLAEKHNVRVIRTTDADPELWLRDRNTHEAYQHDDNFRRRVQAYAKLFAEVTFEAIQPEHQPRLLGVWSDGIVVNTSDPEYWTEARVKEFDPQHCDRCNRKIRRVRSFIVHLPGEDRTMQVGGSCADALDCEKNFAKIKASLDTFVQQLSDDDDYDFAGRVSRVDNMDKVLRLAVVLVQTYGYVSQKMADIIGQPPTSQLLNEALYPQPTRSNWARVVHMEADELPPQVGVQTFVDHFTEKFATAGWSTFTANCMAVLERCKADKLGMITWMAGDIVGNVAKGVEAPTKPLDLPTSKTINIPGTFTVYRSGTGCGTYGYFQWYIAVDEHGNGITWVHNTGAEELEHHTGDKLTLRAGVKGINAKGTLLTLTRVKVLTKIEAPSVFGVDEEDHDDDK